MLDFLTPQGLLKTLWGKRRQCCPCDSDQQHYADVNMHLCFIYLYHVAIQYCKDHNLSSFGQSKCKSLAQKSILALMSGLPPPPPPPTHTRTLLNDRVIEHDMKPCLEFSFVM